MFDVYAAARTHAARMREYYDAYIEVGFSADEAMRLCIVLLTGAVDTMD